MAKENLFINNLRKFMKHMINEDSIFVSILLERNEKVVFYYYFCQINLSFSCIYYIFLVCINFKKYNLFFSFSHLESPMIVGIIRHSVLSN